jgi:putative aminopeptidase FrvX
MVNELINIAQTQKISYALDIYPYYSSDASAALSGGHDIKAALIGPGVHASHTLERTHEDALRNTLQLLIGYVK